MDSDGKASGKSRFSLKFPDISMPSFGRQKEGSPRGEIQRPVDIPGNCQLAFSSSLQ